MNKEQFIVNLEGDYHYDYRVKNKVQSNSYFNSKEDKLNWDVKFNKRLRQIYHNLSFQNILKTLGSLFIRHDSQMISDPLFKLHLTRKDLYFIGLCLIWYLTSSITNNIGKTILNHFPYPFTLTFLQFGIITLALGVIRPWFQENNKNKYQAEVIALKASAPLAAFQIVSHLFNSWAIEYLPVAFVFTLKSLSPLFTVGINWLIFAKTYSRRIYVSLLVLTLGVALFCFGGLSYHILGTLFAILSSLTYVVQSIFTKRQLFHPTTSNNHEHPNKFSLLFHSSLLAFMILLPVWLFSEFSIIINDTSLDISVLKLCVLFAIKGLSQASQALISFALLESTDTVTFTILSLLKRVIVILIAMAWFQLPWNALQVIGIIFTLFGLYSYDTAKRVKLN